MHHHVDGIFYLKDKNEGHFVVTRTNVNESIVL